MKNMNYIPKVDSNYVKFGSFSMMKDIISSKMFYPTFITGLSGNGKTMMVEQVCATTKREMIRVNITIETDEDDLLGGFRLVNGETVFEHGPVVEAMKRGAVLLLDEIDLGSNKIMCLQPILEGKGVFLKKTNEYIMPENGFNVIATANTKGRGNEDGKYIGTNILNEAFLERFAITVEQDYPTASVESKILTKLMNKLDCFDDVFLKNLVDWADIIRKTYFEGGIDEIITTRRLVHIVNAFNIFKDERKALTLCLSRFDEETKVSFLELYDRLDPRDAENNVMENTENAN